MCQFFAMRSLSALLVLLLVGAVSAISATGNRLLAILDDAADKAKYSQFLGDLGGTFLPKQAISKMPAS